MKRLLLACGGCLAAFSLTVPLGCGSAFTTASATGDGGTDGLAPIDGTPAEGGASDGTVPEEDGVTPGEAGLEAGAPRTVVYVSTATGEDANDGTNPTLPKKTIAQGLTRAQAIGAAASVEVCKGTYPETMLTLVQSIPLRGAYDCTSWTRTATYGYPAASGSPGFDGTNTTLIENATPVQQTATLVVTASSAVVDGFVIAGASTSSGPTVGIQVTGSASPLIANDDVRGGGGVGSTTAGSVGVNILGGSPEVRFCILAGGSGTGNPGSEAIAITSTNGSPYVHDDLISGGTGTPTVTGNLASVGVMAMTSLTQATALKGLTVAGSDSAGVAGSSAGIMVSGTGLTVDIEGSAISGGTGALASTFSEAVAVDSAGGTTRVATDRIYGGNRTGPSSQTYGVQAVRVGTLSVTNTEIHAGTTLTSMGATSTGIEVASATAVNVTFDTIYSGQGAGAALSVAAGITGVVVTDDLLAGGGPASGATAVQTGSCSGELAALDYTAFVNFPDLYSCPSDVPPTTIPALGTALPGANTTGNIELESGLCAAATSCVPDPSCPAAPAACLPSLFGASWTVDDDGLTGLIDGPPVGDAATADHGWSLLGASIPCALATGGTPIQGDGTDLFGATRDASTPTMGAAEYSSTCTK